MKFKGITFSFIAGLAIAIILPSRAGLAQEARTEVTPSRAAADANKTASAKEASIDSREPTPPPSKGTRPPAATTVSFLPVGLFASVIEPNAIETQHVGAVSVPPVSKVVRSSNNDDRAVLAKRLRNPVSSLASLSLRNSVDFGLAADRDGWRYTMSLEPVLPIRLNKDWNLISRTILPFIQQDEVVPNTIPTAGLLSSIQSALSSRGSGSLAGGIGAASQLLRGTNTSVGGGIVPVPPMRVENLVSQTIAPFSQEDGPVQGTMQTGLGDMVQSFLLSPSRESLFWGAGVALLLPTATETPLGAGKFGVGPTLAIGRQHGGWTYGGLARQIWSAAGHRDRPDVRSTFIQPFAAYTTRSAWTYSLDTESAYDWVGKQWSVPVHFEVTKVVPFGRLPVSVGAAVTCWAATPPGGPQGFGVRFIVTPLFPAR